MQSLIITGGGSDKIQEYLLKFFTDEKIDILDRDINVFEKSVGIKDVREIAKRIYLKPIKSPTKAVVINAEAGLTAESQNALLKILEEPPNNTVIILTISDKNSLLPTVLSRCKIIELKDNNAKLSKEKNSEYQSILMSLSEQGVGEKLKLAQDIGKTRDEASMFLEGMILVTREKLIRESDKNKASEYLDLLKKFQKSYIDVKTTNVSPRLALESLLLNL